MTRKEAIFILKIIIEECEERNEPRSKEAVKLGIEALEYMDEGGGRKGVAKLISNFNNAFPKY